MWKKATGIVRSPRASHSGGAFTSLGLKGPKEGMVPTQSYPVHSLISFQSPAGAPPLAEPKQKPEEVILRCTAPP